MNQEDHRSRRDPEQDRHPILLLGEDIHLLASRGLILTRAGYAIHLLRFDELHEITDPPPAELTILCHTLALPHLDVAVTWVRTHLPHSKLLLLQKHGPQVPDHLLNIPRSGTQPSDLLDRIREFLQEPDANRHDA